MIELFAHAGEGHGPNAMLLIGIIAAVAVLSFAATALVAAARSGRLGRRER